MLEFHIPKTMENRFKFQKLKQQRESEFYPIIGIQIIVRSIVTSKAYLIRCLSIYRKIGIP